MKSSQLQKYRLNFSKVVDQFDFKKVRKIMKKLDWKWGAYNDARVPKVEEMQETCWDLLNSVLDNLEEIPAGSASTGGFEVYLENSGNLGIKFVLESAEYEVETGEAY